MAATAPRMTWGYWLGCYSSQGIPAWLLQSPEWPGVQAWLLQGPGWPGGTGLATAAHRGYWPGCYSAQGVLAWLLGWPWGTDLAATGPRLAWGYRPCCYRAQGGLGVQAWLLQPTGSTGLAATAHRGVLAWLLGWPGGTDLAATGPRLAWGYWPCC